LKAAYYNIHLTVFLVTTMARGDPDPASKGQPATMICAGIAV
jgi:hypothetical protein